MRFMGTEARSSSTEQHSICPPDFLFRIAAYIFIDPGLRELRPGPRDTNDIVFRFLNYRQRRPLPILRERYGLTPPPLDVFTCGSEAVPQV